MKVKDFPNWCKVVFNDRVILKSDLRYMSWQQIRVIDEMEVILAEKNGKTLVLENRRRGFGPFFLCRFSGLKCNGLKHYHFIRLKR